MVFYKGDKVWVRGDRGIIKAIGFKKRGQNTYLVRFSPDLEMWVLHQDMMTSDMMKATLFTLEEITSCLI